MKLADLEPAIVKEPTDRRRAQFFAMPDNERRAVPVRHLEPPPTKHRRRGLGIGRADHDLPAGGANDVGKWALGKDPPVTDQRDMVGGLFDLDRARLAADLDASRGRERELSEAAAQALATVEKAMAEVEAALSEPKE